MIDWLRLCNMIVLMDQKIFKLLIADVYPLSLRFWAMACLTIFVSLDLSASQTKTMTTKAQAHIYKDLQKKIWLKAQVFQSLFSRPIQVIVQDRAENTPLGALTTKGGSCLIIVNSRPAVWVFWDKLLNVGELSESQAIEFATAHEVAHCVQLTRLSGTDYDKALSKPEHFADLFALNYLSHTLNENEFKKVLHGVIALRRKTTQFWNTLYSTEKTLRAAQSDLLANNQNQFSQDKNQAKYLQELPRQTFLLLDKHSFSN